MIRPGINDNVLVAKPTINEKGTLEVNFKELAEARQTTGGFDDILNTLASSDDDTSGDSSSEQKILMFPFELTDKDDNKLDVTGITAQIAAMKDPLNHILKAFLTSDKIRWNMMNGTGLDNRQLTDAQKQGMFLKQEVLDALYRNIANEFIRMYNLIPSPEQKPMRMLFIRRSKTAHYIAFRRRYLGDNPFIEPMSIPQANSRLRFTDWEKDKGMDNPDPVKTAKDGEETSGSGKSLLGQAPAAGQQTQQANPMLQPSAPAPQNAPAANPAMMPGQAPFQQPQAQPEAQPQQQGWTPPAQPQQAPQQQQYQQPQAPQYVNPAEQQFEQQAGQPTQAFPPQNGAPAQQWQQPAPAPQTANQLMGQPAQPQNQPTQQPTQQSQANSLLNSINQ